MKKLLLILTCLTASAAMAQDAAPRILLHGFGEWAYVRTDGNEYLGGNEDGDADTVGLGLNVTAPINDKLTVIGQFALRTGEESIEPELDYAFAQWRFSDALQVRFGRSKHPFGIYTETFDIGTLRPFFHVPLSIYGPAEIAAQSYNGIGLFGTRQLSGIQALDYDVYAGEVTFEESQRLFEDDEAEHVRDVIGGRVRYSTAVEGLSFGASAYTGTLEEEEDEGGEEHEHSAARHIGAGLHAEYAMHPLTIRAELGGHDEENEGQTKAFYLEAGYRIGQHLELAARYDQFDVTAEEDDEEDAEHRDVSLGANYWFNPNFVLKASLHFVNGFAAAAPHDDDDGDDTRAFVFGAQFSF